jgi:flagellar motor switch/type III secretory pathway protein FliN
MATVQTPPTPVNTPPRPPDLPRKAENAAEQALVPSPHPPEGAKIPLTVAMSKLPVELEVAVPVREFRVRDLLSLAPGHVLETEWAHGSDMPLASGEVQLAWSEFEVVESQLAVRVTRLL